MQKSLLTFNVHVGHYSSDDHLVKTLNALQPTSVFFYLDNPEQMRRVNLVRDRIPSDTLAFLRFFVPPPSPAERDGLEGKFHLPGNDDGWVLSPRTFHERYMGSSNATTIINLLNEPDGNSNEKALHRYTDQAIYWPGRKPGSRILGVNFATGHPARIKEDVPFGEEWHPKHDPLLTLFSMNRHRDVLGFHEYLPGEGYRVGRLMAAYRRCQTLGIPYFKSYVSEGPTYDNAFDGTGKDSFRSRGISGRQLADDVVAVTKSQYLDLAKEGHFLGAAMFCWGNSGGWGGFDLQGDPDKDEFLRRLIEITPRFEVKPPAPIVVTPPAPEPAPAPEPPKPVEPAPAPSLWQPRTLTKRVRGGWVNLRQRPNASNRSTVLVKINDGEQVLYNPADSFIGWAKVRYQDREGFVSLSVCRLVK